MLQRALTVGGGGGNIGDIDVQLIFSEPMANGNKTITASSLTEVDRVIFWYDANNALRGDQWLENGTLVGTYPNETLKIVTISGNTFTIKWNASGDRVSFVVMGKA